MLDKLLPPGIRKSQLNKRVAEQINELVIQNVENLRWAVFQNIDKSFISFRSELDGQFRRTLSATHDAIEAALKKRKDHAETISVELARFESALNTLTEIKEVLDHNQQLQSFSKGQLSEQP